MDVFAVIPARGGSTRVPRKNVRTLGEKPLIAHTLDQAADSELIDRTIVSTDDDEIARVAEAHGGSVPFERPAELSTDESTSPPVIEHALDWVESSGAAPDVVVMLQVTTPFRTTDDIDNAIDMLRNHSDATSVVSVAEFDVPPYWAIERDETGLLSEHFDAGVLWTDDIPRSQDFETLYYPNGAVFAAHTEAFREAVSFYTDETVGYVMPPERSLDIDEPHELELARALYRYRTSPSEN
jgi:CMP-N-acetylneuraminic acid synthetase